MLIIRHAFRFSLLAWGTTLVAGISGTAEAQTIPQQFKNPCDTVLPSPPVFGEDGIASRPDRGEQQDQPIKTNGLLPADDGVIVYDANQGLCWLANANLAGDSRVRAVWGVAGINPDGTMDYPTALNWVEALNHYDGGRGYLGHNNWQLPVTPKSDPTCSSSNNGSFGATCTGSALGNLYAVGLARTFPDSVVPEFIDKVGPFLNLQPALYWTSNQNSGGEVTFSFSTDLQGSNTTKYNYFHVLPMAVGPIGTPPVGTGVLRYMSGSAAGRAVYDTNTGISWTLDANLAALKNFGVTGTTSITSTVNGSVLTVPLIDADGTMLFATASQPGGWLAGMNLANYAGTNTWMFPGIADLATLFQDLHLQPGGVGLESREHVGPFRRLQPFFYWACQRDQNGDSRSPCSPTLNPPPNPGGAPMRWSFDFDNGFEGTDETTKQFYVEVYYPAPRAPMLR